MAFEVTDISRQQAAGEVRLVASVSGSGAAQAIWFQTADGPVCERGDPFVPAVLFPAMRVGVPLRIAGAVAAAVLEGAERVQHVRMVWDPASSLVPIEVAARLPAHDRPGDAVAAFFSGGVDSFYTLRRHRDTITHLVVVQGFDIPLDRDAFFTQVLDRVTAVARALGLAVLAVRTNVRHFTGPYVSWDDAHGAAMAAVAHFLAPRLRRVYIPSSYALAYLNPHGSHPGLDPLWSTPALEIVHDGAEATRFEKVAALADWELALRHLRVCWQLADGQYNCGRCRKCLWTMAFLRACGVLERASTFPRVLDLEALRDHPPARLDGQARFVQALAMVERRGDDPQLAACLREGIARARARGVRALPRRLGRRLVAVLRGGRG